MTNNANPDVTIKRRASTMQVKPEESKAHPDPAETAHEDTTPDDEKVQEDAGQASAPDDETLRADLAAGMLAKDASLKYGWSVQTIRKKAKEWGIQLKRGRPTKATQEASGKSAAKKPRKKQSRSKTKDFIGERVSALEWLMQVATSQDIPLAECAGKAKRALEAYELLAGQE